jgi:photosystem II stability/assembly factor-like uncharacterized protein
MNRLYTFAYGRIALILGVVLCSTFAQAQTPAYQEMMDDHSINFYDVVKAATTYFETHDRGKGSGWKDFERWRNANESKYGPSGDRSTSDPLIAQKAYKELASAHSIKNKVSFTDGWEELGPWDANTITSHYSPGIGRVETFWVDPTDDKHMYVGSRSGGFWRTSNGGTTWQNTTDFLPATGVQCIAVNPNNKNEVLIAVQQGGNNNSHGIYRSTDAGATWVETNFNPVTLKWGGLGDNTKIYALGYNPNVPNQVVVGGTRGVFVSSDNLATWTNATTGNITEVAFHPTNGSIIYAYNNSGTARNFLLKSSNGGVNFSTAGTFLNNNNSKIILSTTAKEPNHIYAASTNGVYKSTNEGLSFTFLSKPTESCFGFAVSDLDTLKMVYGYVNLQASTDGGTTFIDRTIWSVQNSAYIHADLRIAQCVNGIFYVGTDGYFAKSTDDGVTWTTLNDGTSIREFYAVGSSQSNYYVHMAGSQDNGTSILNKDGWIEWNGGDGMEALVLPLNPDWMIGSWQYGTRSYTRDGGSDRPGTGNPDRGSGNAAWEAPLLQNPLNQMQVIHMSDSLFTGDNFGLEWNYRGSPNIGILNEGSVAESDSNVIAVARNNNIRLSTDGGFTWKNIGIGLPGHNFTDISFDPKDANTIVVTYNRSQNDGQKIYISTDQGATWQNITYNLNNMPLRTAVIDHSDSSYIYVGGEIGVYYKSKNATEWTLYNDNLPNLTVMDLEIHYGTNRLRAATWGRGLWEYSLVGRNNYPSITHTSITSTPDENSPKETIEQYVYATILSQNPMATVKVRWSEGDQSLIKETSMKNIGGNEWKSEQPIGDAKLGAHVYFKVLATTNSGDQSESYRFDYTVNKFEHCAATGSAGTGADYINAVELNGTKKESGQEFYADFRSTKFQLNEDSTYTVTVGMNYHWDSDSITAWIDYNGDASLDKSEQVVFTKLDNKLATATLKAPAGILTDKDLLMRVRSQYYSNIMDPCGDKAGEVEDYTVNFSHSTLALPSPATITAHISPNPSAGYIEVNVGTLSKSIQVSVCDIAGRVILQSTAYNATNMPLKIEATAGTYLLKITTENGSSTQKLIIN